MACCGYSAHHTAKFQRRGAERIDSAASVWANFGVNQPGDLRLPLEGEGEGGGSQRDLERRLKDGNKRFAPSLVVYIAVTLPLFRPLNASKPSPSAAKFALFPAPPHSPTSSMMLVIHGRKRSGHKPEASEEQALTAGQPIFRMPSLNFKFANPRLRVCALFPSKGAIGT